MHASLQSVEADGLIDAMTGCPPEVQSERRADMLFFLFYVQAVDASCPGKVPGTYRLAPDSPGIRKPVKKRDVTSGFEMEKQQIVC